MQVNVTGRHVEISDAIRDYVYDKIESELTAFPRITTVHVVLNVEKHRQMAEFDVRAAHHIHIEADAESTDLYVSIDEAMEKVVRQLRKHRDKLVDHKGGTGLGENEARIEGGSAEDVK